MQPYWTRESVTETMPPSSAWKSTSGTGINNDVITRSANHQQRRHHRATHLKGRSAPNARMKSQNLTGRSISKAPIEVTTEDCSVAMLEANSAPRSAMHPYSTGKSTPQTGREVVIKQVMKDHKLDVPVTIHVKRNLREMLPQHPDRHCIQTAHTHAN